MDRCTSRPLLLVSAALVIAACGNAGSTAGPDTSMPAIVANVEEPRTSSTTSTTSTTVASTTTTVSQSEITDRYCAKAREAIDVAIDFLDVNGLEAIESVEYAELSDEVINAVEPIPLEIADVYPTQAEALSDLHELRVATGKPLTEAELTEIFSPTVRQAIEAVDLFDEEQCGTTFDQVLASTREDPNSATRFPLVSGAVVFVDPQRSYVLDTDPAWFPLPESAESATAERWVVAEDDANGVNANLNVVTAPVPDVDLQTYLDQNVAGLLRGLPGIVIVRAELIQGTFGQELGVIESNFTDADNIEFSFVQYYAIADDEAAIVTLTTATERMSEVLLDVGPYMRTITRLTP